MWRVLKGLVAVVTFERVTCLTGKLISANAVQVLARNQIAARWSALSDEVCDPSRMAYMAFAAPHDLCINGLHALTRVKMLPCTGGSLESPGFPMEPLISSDRSPNGLKPAK